MAWGGSKSGGLRSVEQFLSLSSSHGDDNRRRGSSKEFLKLGGTYKRPEAGAKTANKNESYRNVSNREVRSASEG